MGPSRPRNSTRAGKARSVKPSPNPRRKPAPPPPSADTRRHLPELSEIRTRLRIVMAAAYVAGAALSSQSADCDADAALVLQRCVADEIDRQIERLDGLIDGGAS